MKRFFVFLFKVLMVLLLAAGLVIAGFVYYVKFIVGAVSTGKPIPKYATPQTALLVVDIQENYSGVNSLAHFPGAAEMVTTVNGLIEYAQKAGWEIVYIGQEFPDNFLFRMFSNRMTLPGHPGTKLDARLKVVNERYFPKSIGDAFSNPALEEYLASKQVGRLVLTGLDAEQCLYKTALGAANRNFDITVVKDAAVTLSSRTMDQVMADYSAKGIHVVSSADLMK